MTKAFSIGSKTVKIEKTLRQVKLDKADQKCSGKQKMILLFYVSLYTLLDKTKFYKIISRTKLLVGHYFSQLPKI